MGQKKFQGENFLSFVTMNIKKILILNLVLIFSIVISALNAAAQNQTGGLAIADLDINVDYEPTNAYNINNLKNSQSLVNKSTTEADIYPGSTVEFEFTIENTFPKRASDDNDNIFIDDISIKITIEGIDDKNDVEEEISPDLELEPDEEADVFLKVSIPRKVDIGTYDVIIEAEGQGSDGLKHTANWDLGLKVTKPSHDIRIETVKLQEQILKCSRDTYITAGIFNAGRQSESNIRLEILNNDLGLSQSARGIELGTKVDPEGSNSEIDFERRFQVKIDANAAAGSYPIAVNVYWNDILFNSKSVDLTVQDCEDKVQTTTTTLPEQEDTGPKEGKEEGFLILTGSVGTQEPETATTETKDEDAEGKIFASREFSFRKSPLFWPLIIGLNLILFIAVAGIAVILVKR